MGNVLITGGTGTLGKPTTTQLRAAGHDVRVLSRRCGPCLLTGDLISGQGVHEALRDVQTVMHLATSAGDDRATSTLVRACRATSTIEHVIVVSIVGVDRIPLPYYRRKLASERIVAASGIPYTILRATQFHDLVVRLFTAQRWSPVLLTPAFSIQPIEVTEVAARLVELCAGTPSHRVPDIGGPKVLSGRAMARQWAAWAGTRRPVRAVRLPGRTFAAYRSGHHLVPGPTFGVHTFAQHLGDRTQADA